MRFETKNPQSTGISKHLCLCRRTSADGCTATQTYALSRHKQLLVILAPVLIMLMIYELSKLDADQIVRSAYSSDCNKIDKSTITWFRLQPYWSVTYERNNGTKRTVMVDPMSRNIFAE
jgi:hypothetical protein